MLVVSPQTDNKEREHSCREHSGWGDDLVSGVQGAIDWLHAEMLPPGVQSTIYTVNQTLVTVQATYLLPAAAAVAIDAAAAAGDHDETLL